MKISSQKKEGKAIERIRLLDAVLLKVCVGTKSLLFGFGPSSFQAILLSKLVVSSLLSEILLSVSRESKQGQSHQHNSRMQQRHFYSCSAMCLA